MGVRGRKAGNIVGNRLRSTRWYNFYLKIFGHSSKGSLVRFLFVFATHEKITDNLAGAL